MTNECLEFRAGLSGSESHPLEVSVRSEAPTAWVVDVRGELDLATGPILEHHLGAYADPRGNVGQPSSIAYLLPRLEFMDARGLHYLLAAADTHDPETITVREPSWQVRRVLELVGLDSMIEGPANR